MSELSNKTKGSIKQAVGTLTANDELKREGERDQIKGEIEGAVDDIKHAVKGIVENAKHSIKGIMK